MVSYNILVSVQDTALGLGQVGAYRTRAQKSIPIIGADFGVPGQCSNRL